MKIKIIIRWTILISIVTMLKLNPATAKFKLQESAHSPIWYDLTYRKAPNYFRTICNQLGATENTKIPPKTNESLRIATYNVHFWQDPWHNFDSPPDDKAYENMIKVIKHLHADIIIIQEVGGSTLSKKHRRDTHELVTLGYKYNVCAETGYFKNCIYSKFPFTETSKVVYKTNPDDKKLEQRVFARAKLRLPGGQELAIYGTHLEVRGDKEKFKVNGIPVISAAEVRISQLKELVQYINTHDRGSNVLIGLDSNNVRKQDLMDRIKGKLLWDIQVERMKKRGEIVSSAPLDYLASQGYIDSFEATSIIPPKFTSMYGTRIDFLFLNKNWNLPLGASGVFYSWASDHIPVFMDISLKPQAVVPGGTPDIPPELPSKRPDKILPDVIPGGTPDIPPSYINPEDIPAITPATKKQ